MQEEQEIQKSGSPYLFFGIFSVIVALIGISILVFGKYGQKSDLQNPTPSATIVEGSATPVAKEPVPIPTMEKVTELLIEDEKIGTGEEAIAGKKITVNYLGTLADGTKFDSSYDRGTPFTFTLGAGEVIEGWDKGFAGMKVGGKRKLTIPSSMAYGDNGIPGAIPGGATLIFEVELLGVE